jgi:hypothetical protein
MKYKALIADIDGTLVQYRPSLSNLAQADALIRQSTIDAVSQLHNSGLKVVAMTGRTFEQSKDILASLGIEGPCAFAGGATIRLIPTGEIIYEASLEPQVVNKVCDVLFAILGNNYPIERAPAQKNIGLFNSLWVIVDKQKLAEINHQLTSIDEIYFVVNDGAGDDSQSGVLVLHKSASKGSATKKLQSLLTVSKQETSCVGDGANDVPMFNECGLAIAMGNGEEILKKSADFIVSNIEDDGFSEAVNYILSAK